MALRVPRFLRVAALLASAFALGGGSTEVALRTHHALERARAEREIGSAGQLVELALIDAEGKVVARPRLIAPAGRPAELVLHDPTDPERVRLSFRVEASREPTGEIALGYALQIPGRDLSTTGRLLLTPGVQAAIELGDGELLATLFALPVPSAAFDAYLEAETTARHAAQNTKA
jgi:hypothetical protein